MCLLFYSFIRTTTTTTTMLFLCSMCFLLSSDLFRNLLESLGVYGSAILVDNYLACLALCVVGGAALRFAASRRNGSFAEVDVFSSADADQIRMMKENCILVDENDNVIGHDTKKRCHLLSNGLPLHRAFSVFLFDQAGRLLLQKRSDDKITFPKYWANTCCSHPLFVDGEKDGVEGVKRAARRKLEQELGIKPEQVPMDSFTFLTRVHYRAACDDTWGEHEVDYIVICRPKKDVTLDLNPNEVSEARYFTKKELKSFVKDFDEQAEGAELISPWFHIIEKQFLHKWWDAVLSSRTPSLTKALSKVADVGTIFRGHMEDISKYQTKKFDASKKQGAYGKVKVHSHGVLAHLLRPSEIVAAVKYKLKKHKSGMLCEGAPKGLSNADILFCEDILSSVSRSFAGVIKELPPVLRLPVAIFYLVLRALDTVEDEMDLSRFQQYATKEIPDTYDVKINMLHKFVDRLTTSGKGCTSTGIGEADERKLVEQFDKVQRVFAALPKGQREVISDITKRMAGGMAEFAGRDLAAGTKDRTEFDLYCHYVAGLVGEGLTKQFVAAGLEHKRIKGARGMMLANSMGLFLQKTNITRDYLEDLVDNRSFWPADVWSLYRDTLPELRVGDEKAMACLNHIITDALYHGPDCLAYLEQLKDPAVFKFCAIPQIMAIATLSECYNNKKVYTGVVKIRKGLAARIVQDCSTMERTRKWFATFASQIMNRVEESDPNAERTIDACIHLGGKKDSVPGGILVVANMLALCLLVTLATRVYGASQQRATLMPRLTSTTEVAELGIAVTLFLYLLGFGGVGIAASDFGSHATSQPIRMGDKKKNA